MLLFQASRYQFSHRRLKDSEDEIDAMDRMREITDSTSFDSSICFPYSRFYLNFETNKVPARYVEIFLIP